jgi:hypothetical protein
MTHLEHTLEAKPSGKAQVVSCPVCSALLLRVSTAYGERATCSTDGLRLTRLHGETTWTREKALPMQGWTIPPEGFRS